MHPRARLSLRRFLVPVDFTAGSLQALQHAARLAVSSDGAELYLLHVMEYASGEASGRAERRPDADQRQTALRHLREEAQRVSAGVRGRFAVRSEVARAPRAAPVILERAATFGADLVVLGTHGRTGAARFSVGSTAERVARSAPCSVFTVRAATGRAPGLVRRVLATIDFSAGSLQVLEMAKGLAACYQARLHLLHVLEPVLQPIIHASGSTVFEFAVPRGEVAAREAMGRLVRRARGPQAPVGIHVLRGRAAPSIRSFAEQRGIHLVVQGAQRLDGPGRPAMGGVAERVVRTAPCPVWTVRDSGSPVPREAGGGSSTAVGAAGPTAATATEAVSGEAGPEREEAASEDIAQQGGGRGQES